MNFITIDENNYITGVFNGSLDYVHRITGDPIPNAFQVPDGAILISEMCMNKIKAAAPTHVAKWDPVNSCIIQELDVSIAGKRKQLFANRLETIMNEEESRIASLTEAALDAELGG